MRKKIDKIERILFILCVFALCIAVLMIKKNEVVSVPSDVKIDTIFIETIDTIHITNTITKYKPLPTKTDTIYIADSLTNEVVQHINKFYACDSLYKDTTCTPPASVNYHLYVKTDNYDIDSVSLKFDVNYPKVTQVQTITKEITKYKKNHITWGIQSGFGYGVFNKKPDFYIGLGVQYNF